MAEPRPPVAAPVAPPPSAAGPPAAADDGAGDEDEEEWALALNGTSPCLTDWLSNPLDNEDMETLRPLGRDRLAATGNGSWRFLAGYWGVGATHSFSQLYQLLWGWQWLGQFLRGSRCLGLSPPPPLGGGRAVG